MKTLSIGLDRDRPLVYNINAVGELEDRFNMPVQEIFSRDSKLGLFRFLRAFILIGLKHGGMNFRGTLEDNELRVGDLIQEHWIDKGRTLNELLKIGFEALELSGVFKEVEEEEGEGNPTKREAQ